MATTTGEQAVPAVAVAPAGVGPTVRQMVALWLPLAISQLMMVLEPTIINIGLGRTRDPELALAAYGVAFSLALLIEAPVLMVLDASVARSADRAAFRLIERFALGLGLAVLAIGLIVSATPLYGVIVEDLMNIPADVAARARPTLLILSFWPLPIGWRRAQQGLLIRTGRTFAISAATVVRLVTLAGALAGGLMLFPRGGAVVAGWAMNLSVTVEAVLVTWAARRALRLATVPNEGSNLGGRDLWRFYQPLATTSIIQQAARPIMNAGIAVAVLGVESLAAWPVAWSLVILIAGPGWSLQQLTNALAVDEAAYRRVTVFCLALCGLFVVLLGLVALTPLYGLAMGGVYNLSAELQALAKPAVVLLIPFPLLLGMQGVLRGVRIRRGYTTAVRSGVVVNVVVLAATIVVGVTLIGPTGVVLAAVANQISIVAELAWLRWKGKGKG
jgi:Na+-driven multidrug efflux pump